MSRLTSFFSMFSSKSAEAASQVAAPPPPPRTSPGQAGPANAWSGPAYQPQQYPAGFHARRADAARANLFRNMSPGFPNPQAAGHFAPPSFAGGHAGHVSGGPQMPFHYPNQRPNAPAPSFTYLRPQTWPPARPHATSNRPGHPVPASAPTTQSVPAAPGKKSGMARFASALGIGRTYSWNTRRHFERMNRVVPVSFTLRDGGKVTLNNVTQGRILSALEEIENEQTDTASGRVARQNASVNDVMDRILNRPPKDGRLAPTYLVESRHGEAVVLNRHDGARWREGVNFSGANPSFEALQTTILELKYYNKPPDEPR